MPAKRRDHAGEHEEQELGARDVDAGEVRGLGVEADVVDAAAEGGEVQQHGEDDREHDERDHDQRDSRCRRSCCVGQVGPLLGKSVTALVPSSPTAMPRKSASVPIVTASDGSPTYATRKPLSAPQQQRRRASATSRRPAIGHAVRRCRTPSSTLLRPDDAGDRQVDLAGDDDQRHRQRDQQDRRDVEQQEVDRQRAVEERHVDRARRRRPATSSAITAASRVSSSRCHERARVRRRTSRAACRRSAVVMTRPSLR